MEERARRRLDAVLGVVGRTFITAGLLLLGLVVYQLWGTGFEQRRAQDRLRADFAELINEPSTTSNNWPNIEPNNPNNVADNVANDSPVSGTPTTSTAVSTAARDGDALALLEIPSIGVADIVVDSATVSALRQGPGHIVGTALPGEAGNSAIAGHRSTYGAPFADLDDVEVGDEIRVTTRSGVHTYVVDDVLIVKPNRTDVLRPRKGRTQLTLVTCHPRFSTANRLIVTAELTASAPLVSNTLPSPVVSTTTPPTTVTDSTMPNSVVPDSTVPAPPEPIPVDDAPELSEIDGWFSDRDAILPSILLGLVLAGIGLITYRARRRLVMRGLGSIGARFVTWSVAALPFLIVLFYWYRFINMLLPASA